MATDSKMIKILVKTPQIKETIEIKEHASVQELKELVSEKFNAELDRLCLIFAGKILKDNETLEQHKITDNLTIHLVIRPKKKPESQNDNTTTSGTTNTSNSTPASTIPSSTTTSSTTNTNAQNPFNLMGIGDYGEFGRDVLNNPEMTSQLFNNPLIQNIMSNPDAIRAMVNLNPQLQQIVERNPELNHFLNNNELLRSTMDMMRNPSAFQELMRTQDRAMSNLESLPGGYNALRRIYTELEEPLLNAASEQMAGENPFASFARQNNSSNTSSSNVQAGTENREVMPNPWSRDTRPSNTGASNGSNLNQNAGGALSSLLENREMMSSLLESPATQQMMQQINSNPALMQSILANNPLLGNLGPNAMPNLLQQMQNPEFRQVLTNPEAIEALMQITRGTETLRRVAPSLFESIMGSGGAMSGLNLNAFGAASTNSSSNTTTTTTTSSANGSRGTNASSNQNSISQLNNLMSQMFSQSGSINTQQPQQAPEEHFREQLELLNTLGFTDRQQNLNALVETFGDVNAAIERILDRRTDSYFS